MRAGQDCGKFQGYSHGCSDSHFLFNSMVYNWLKSVGSHADLALIRIWRLEPYSRICSLVRISVYQIVASELSWMRSINRPGHLHSLGLHAQMRVPVNFGDGRVLPSLGSKPTPDFPTLP